MTKPALKQLKSLFKKLIWMTMQYFYYQHRNSYIMKNTENLLKGSRKAQKIHLKRH